MTVTFVAASAAGGWAAMNEQNDDRWRAYAPFGIDDAIDASFAAAELAGGLLSRRGRADWRLHARPRILSA